jgi:uncharacterized protein YndB with AHSA1/START domain
MTRTDEASRFIPADPDLIYRALIDPAAVAEWLPPTGMAGRIDEWDARPGGAYRMTLTYDQAGGGKSTADSDVVKGRFVELVPGERMVQTGDFESDDPAFAGTMRMTWMLEPAATGTLVHIRADDVPQGITAEDHATGLASSLENLAAFVAG